MKNYVLDLKNVRKLKKVSPDKLKRP